MTPYIMILTGALIGGYLYGVAGFFFWGIVAYGAVIIIGLALRKTSGGILPKKVRVQTAKDFIAEQRELVSTAWPTHSASKQTKEIENLLEAMYRRAITESKSFDVDAAGDIDNFIAGANAIVSEQNSAEVQAIAKELIEYLLSHPLWYGLPRNT